MQNNSNKSVFWDVFSEICFLKGIAPSTAIREMKLSPSTMANWKNGGIPFDSTIRKIADYFDIYPEVMTGTLNVLTDEDPSVREPAEETWKQDLKPLVMQSPKEDEKKHQSSINDEIFHKGIMRDLIREGKRYGKFTNVLDLGTKKVPLLGEIACGQPIYANEERGEYYLVSGDIDTDFCLQAKGDSMINARILDGDIVFCKYQPVVENGEIAAVIIGDEATLKRFYFDKEKQRITLVPENPRYEPLVYIGSDMAGVRVLGKAVAFQSRIK